jgi:uncharacterized protein YgfB (UPF0149 family)
MPAHDPSLFERLSPLLDPLDPAELHGLLCGLLCLNADLDRDRWLNYAREALADGREWSEPVGDLLAKLLEFGAAQMNAPDWPVIPLLPDDDAPLRQRVDALGHWCHGLLYGLGLGEVELRGALSEESWEFLDDVTDIAQIGFDTDEAGETDETAYTEVVEYLRVGLLMIQQDIQHSTAPSPPRLH